MKNFYLFFYLLLGSISLNAQFRLDIAGNARIQGKLDITAAGSNVFIGWESGISNYTSPFSQVGSLNTFVGAQAGKNNAGGQENTFLGTFTGLNNTGGNFNTFVGSGAGVGNSTGLANTFIGNDAGASNTTGLENTFIGQQAGLMNVEGSNNTLLGEDAGRNSTSSGNTFVGSKAGVSNTNGDWNTFMGRSAGHSNNSGFQNTFIGYETGFTNTIGAENTFIGRGAGYDNRSGAANIFIGGFAGRHNTAGQGNTYVGYRAGEFASGSELTAFGFYATASLISDSNPTNNAFVIGSHGLITSSHSGTLGNLSTQRITGYVNFGTASDGRMKKQIREDVHGLDFILALRPVSYQVDALKLDQFLRQGMEKVRAGKDDQSAEEKAKARERQATYEGFLRAKSAIRYTGFIAQEVEKAMQESGFEFSGLVKPEHEQDHYSLRYAEFVVPLVKGMQEQQEVIKHQERENQEQKQQITQLQSEVTELRALVERLLAGQNQTPDPGSERKPKPQARLSQNFPNPFHEDTQIEYSLPESIGNAHLDIHSVEGKLIESIPLSPSGSGRVTIKAGRYPAGTYVYSLVNGEEVLATRRMVLTR